MTRALLARFVRLLLVAGWTAAVFGLVVVLDRVVGEGQRLLLPFVAAGAAAAGMVVFRKPIDRLVRALTHHRLTTPYSVLAQTTARVGAGSLEQALPGLAQVLAEGTGAQRAALWLAVGDRLVEAACFPPRAPYPPGPPGSPGPAGGRVPSGDSTMFDPSTLSGSYSAARPTPRGGAQVPAAANLAVLLARPGTDFVVPVLDGSVLRAALVIDKPDGSVTPADRRLMQDVADGAGLLLRSVARGVELHERVRRADELAAELRESRQRLTQAREVERRRLVNELSHATTDQLATLRKALRTVHRELDATPGPSSSVPTSSVGTSSVGTSSASGAEPAAGSEPARRAVAALTPARVALDELLQRFRVIARGVYPAVLRDQGPAAALDEVLADLPRSVRLSGDATARLAWEVESGIYYLAAAAVTHLAGRAAPTDLHVQLEHRDGRLAVRIDDLALGWGAAAALRAELAGDVERLAALGGAVEITEYAAGVTVFAWLPDRLEPLVEPGAAA